MKIYTKTGDRGKTGLFGGGRVSKQNARIEAYGTLDELNAFLGWFLTLSRHKDLNTVIGGVQSRLFDLGAHLATPSTAAKAKSVLPPLDPQWVTMLEEQIDSLDAELPPLTQFILPGGNQEAAVLHVARAVCRRAERAVVRVRGRDRLDDTIIPYLNRLSDLLFVCARAVTARAGIEETPWSPVRPG